MLNRNFLESIYCYHFIIFSSFQDNRLSSRQCRRYFFCVFYFYHVQWLREVIFLPCASYLPSNGRLSSQHFPNPREYNILCPFYTACHVLTFVFAKLLPITRSTPTFKLAIILLLAGDVSLNPGSFGWLPQTFDQFWIRQHHLAIY